MWMALLKKELRLQRDFMIGTLVVLLVMGGAGVILVLTGNKQLATLFLLVPLLWHFVFLPIYMMASLNYEWKHAASTWMQMPLAGWKLLLAKLGSGMLYFLGSFTLSVLFFFLAVGLGLHGEGPIIDFLRVLTTRHLTDGGVSYLFFLGLCLYVNLMLAPFFIAYNVLRQWLRSTVTKFAGFLTLALGAAIIWLFITVSETEVYQSLSEWGEFGYRIEPLEIGPFYTGELLTDLLLSILFIALSGWLIDRKVQV